MCICCGLSENKPDWRNAKQKTQRWARSRCGQIIHIRREMLCCCFKFFLIGGEQRARESETRAEAVTVIKGSVGEKDKS